MRGKADTVREESNTSMVTYDRMETEMIGSDQSSLGPAAAVLALVGYRGSVRMPY